MTPAAITPAGSAATKNASVPGHGHKLREQPAPRAPRRVSGPVRGRATGAAVPYPQRAPGRARTTPLGARVLAFVRALPDHALLDRVVRGRAWILLLGLMLAGIVAMQVEVLKLGASMGRSIQEGTGLQSRNELLRASVASLADDQRIERLAAGMGMIMPAPDGVGFLAAHPRPDVQQAIANIHPPNAQGFLSLITANGAIATGPSAPQGPNTSSSAATSTSQPTTSASQPTTSTPAPVQSPVQTTSTAQASAPTAASASPSGQPASSAGAAAPTQVAPPQTTSSQTSGQGTGGAGIPTGG
jgi:hypothetical protein